MIVPENGLLLSSGNTVLEVSFDWLMYRHHENVIGDSADRFGYEFPIRFDFLDTFDGQNLSLQYHPRPINIERAFDNLQFDRKGKTKIEKEFISTPYELESGDDWQLIHLPAHPEHFYDIHRYDFTSEVEVNTDGSCDIMNLVEGESIKLETKNGVRQRFNFAETFVVPAAAESYRLINESEEPAKVVQAFIKL